MIPTPNLDRLGSQGMRFIEAHLATSVCSHSRQGLLIGRYCWQTNLKKDVLSTWDKPLIEGDRLTIGGMLQKAGYHTAYIGKWHFGWDWRTTDGSATNIDNCTENDCTKPITESSTTCVFNYYWGDDVISHPRFTYIKNNKVFKVPTVCKVPGDWETGAAITDDYKIENVLPDLADKVIENILDRAKRKSPFSLYSLMNAHHGSIAPLKVFQESTKVLPYGNIVHQIDALVEQIIEVLENASVINNVYSEYPEIVRNMKTILEQYKEMGEVHLFLLLIKLLYLIKK